MSEYPIMQVEKIGLTLDRPGAILPPEAWTYGKNVVFTMEGVQRAWGEIPFIPEVLGIVPHMLLSSAREELGWQMLAATGLALQAHEAGAWADRTGSTAWVSDPKFPVTGGYLNGLPIMNSPLSAPIFRVENEDAELLPIVGNGTGYAGATRFDVLRPFGNFLIGLGARLDGGAYTVSDSHRVVWSDAADPGSVPPTWDPTAPSSLAGDTVLSETQGVFVEAVQLGNIMYLYKDDAVHTMQFIGGQYVFKFALKFKEFGAMNTNCVIPFKNNHFVVTSTGFIVHNGTSWKSIDDNKVRKFFLGDLDRANYKSLFCVANIIRQEIYVFYPSLSSGDSSGACTRMLTWNWDTGAWGQRDCAPTLCGGNGFIPQNDILTWADWQGTWGDMDQTASWASLHSPASENFVFYGDTSGNVRSISPTYTKYGDVFETLLVRTGVTLEYKDRHGNVIGNPRGVKLCTEVWPYLGSSEPVEITVGSHRLINTKLADIVWGETFIFDPNEDEFITPEVSGQYMAIKFRSITESNFTLSGYMMVIQDTGDFA